MARRIVIYVLPHFLISSSRPGSCIFSLHLAATVTRSGYIDLAEMNRYPLYGLMKNLAPIFYEKTWFAHSREILDFPA